MAIPVVNTTRTLSVARRYAESNMTAAVTIVRKLPVEFDEETGTLQSNSPIPIYTGKARIYPVTGVLKFNYGDEPSYFSSAIVSIPVVTDDLPMVDDIVLVDSCPGDPAVVGRVFAVKDVEAGSQWLAARRLQVVGVQESQQWSWPAAIITQAGRATASGRPGVLVGDAP